jgi:ACR3 family arsenite transporter
MTQTIATPAPPAASPLGTFERYLSLWVALAILAGLALGLVAPGVAGALAGFEYASVNLVVAVLIWAMIYPMMVGVDFASVKDIGRKPKGLVITLVVNWLVKPFTMAALALLFFDYLYAGLMSEGDADQYIAGLIILGAAPCTAMVFVWSQLTKGDPAYTLVQVSVNDLVMIVAFAPIVALLLGVTDIVVPWETLLLSVALYVVIPLAAGALTRRRVIASHGGAAQAMVDRGAAGDGGAAVRLPGRNHRLQPAADRADRHSDHHPVLWHFRTRLCGSQGVEGPA